MQCCEEETAWCVIGRAEKLRKMNLKGARERGRGGEREVFVCLLDILISHFVPNNILTRFLSRHVNKSNCIDILRSFRLKKKKTQLMRETRRSLDSNLVLPQRRKCTGRHTKRTVPLLVHCRLHHVHHNRKTV